MNPDDQLSLLNILILPCLALAFFMTHPHHAEKSYHRNMKWVPHLLPGRWKEKEYYVKWTRRLARVWLIVLTLVYFVFMFLLLKQRSSY